jgi:hypothetical protein
VDCQTSALTRDQLMLHVFRQLGKRSRYSLNITIMNRKYPNAPVSDRPQVVQATAIHTC